MKCRFENEQMLEETIKEVVACKINAFDERFSFGPSLGFGVEYYKKIHQFLFSDFYEGTGEFRTGFDEQDVKRINYTVESLADMAYEFSPDLYPEFMEAVEYLKDIQAFPDGNKRTIYAYVKQLIGAYNLPIELEPLDEKKSSELTNNQVHLK